MLEKSSVPGLTLFQSSTFCVIFPSQPDDWLELGGSAMVGPSHRRQRVRILFFLGIDWVHTPHNHSAVTLVLSGLTEVLLKKGRTEQMIQVPWCLAH